MRCICRSVQLVAARYNSGGTTASAVILLEAAIREFEETLGLRHPGIVALSRRAEQLFETLPSEARAKVPVTPPGHWCLAHNSAHCRHISNDVMMCQTCVRVECHHLHTAMCFRCQRSGVRRVSCQRWRRPSPKNWQRTAVRLAVRAKQRCGIVARWKVCLD